jgi:prepilin-type N-terminal cleavage/methylation domain-containing protein
MRERPIPKSRATERGMTLIETLVALAILLVASVGLMTLAATAIITTENQGHLAARVAEYAQDKMEQLMSLKYANECVPADCSTANAADTVTITSTVNCVQFLVNSACDTGGSGLTIRGTSDVDCTVATCVDLNIDWLDANGNPIGGGVAQPTGWFYKRVWLVEQVTTNLKRITVACTTKSNITSRRGGITPHATMVMLKTSPF